MQLDLSQPTSHNLFMEDEAGLKSYVQPTKQTDRSMMMFMYL